MDCQCLTVLLFVLSKWLPVPLVVCCGLGCGSRTMSLGNVGNANMIGDRCVNRRADMHIVESTTQTIR